MTETKMHGTWLHHIILAMTTETLVKTRLICKKMNSFDINIDPDKLANESTGKFLINVFENGKKLE